MPGRYIREGLLDSDRFEALREHGGAQAQLFYMLLLLCVDDYGRCRNHPIWLRSKVFPLRDDIRETDISRWLAACEKSGLIAFYGEAEGDTTFIQVYNFGQQTRSKSKYPDPPGNLFQQSNALQADACRKKTLQNNALQCKTMLSLNVNGNVNDNERDARPREDSPEKNISDSVEVMPYPKQNQEGIRAVKKNAEAIGYSMSDEDAENFIAFYESTGWTRNGQKIRRWPSLLVKWRNVARNDAKEKGGKKNADCREITLDAAEYFKKPF